MAQTVLIPRSVMKQARLENLYRIWDKTYGATFDTNFVPGAGSVLARVAFVGEAPGRQEDEQGKPFVGPAGRVLDKLLKHAHLRREKVFITNLVKWRPPKNRDLLKDEIGQNLGFLKMELDIINPDVVVTLGRFSAQLFFENPHMPSLAGCVHVKRGRVIVPMYHPAVAVYDKQMLDMMKEHILAVRDVLRSYPLDERPQ